MKRTLAIIALEVCATPCLLGQMAGMATPDGAAIPVTWLSDQLAIGIDAHVIYVANFSSNNVTVIR